MSGDRGKRGLEQELTELLEVERFEPPEEFREAALWSDPAVYEEAAADPEAWWLRQATELLDWAEEPSESLDESDPPFYRWFADGQLNASANCLDRHVEAGRGDRVAYHWRGEEGEERDDHLRRAARRRAALRQRPARPRDRQGRRGRHLPADDPRGGRRDARLRADRRPPQRRLRRLLGRGGARADGVLRGEGAGHRRRRPPQGQDGAGQGRRSTRRSAGSARSRRSSSSATPAPSARCARGATSGSTRRWRRPRPSARPEPMGAEDPLFILYTSGSTAKPKGILHTTGGYLPASPTPTATSST